MKIRACWLGLGLLVALGWGCGGSSDDDPGGSTPPTGNQPPGMTTSPVGSGVTGGAPGVPPANMGMTAPPPAASGGPGSAGMGAGGSMGEPATPAGSGGSPAEPGGEDVPPGVSDWRMIGYDLASTYYNRAERVLTKENAANLKEAYVLDMGGPVYGAPLQVGDTIYASSPGNVVAVEAATGTEKWRTPARSTGSLAFQDGTLYLNTLSASVVAINATDGKQLWSKPGHASQRADGSSSPLVAGDLILIGGSNGGIELSTGQFRGYMTALKRMTGDIAWTEHTVPETAKGASIWSSPAADLQAGRAYGSTGNNYGPPATDSSDAIIAFDLMTGAIAWKAQLVTGDAFSLGSGLPDADFGANPVLFEAMVEGTMTQLVGAGSKGGKAFAVRRDNGMTVWTRELCMGQPDGSRGIFVNSTWSGKNLLIACNEGGPATLYALDGGTGNVTWMRPLTGQVWGRMSVANGVGFVGTGTNLEAFDVDTGAVIKTIPSKGGTVAGTITIANGRVAFGEGFTWGGGKTGSKLTVLTVQ
jgi:outer membrane protein assembly factor BamB